MEDFYSLCKKNHYFTMPTPVPESQILRVPKIGAHTHHLSIRQAGTFGCFPFPIRDFFTYRFDSTE